MMRVLLLNARGKPLIFRHGDRGEVFEVGEPIKAVRTKLIHDIFGFNDLFPGSGIILHHRAPTYHKFLVSVAPPACGLPLPEVIEPDLPQVVPVHGLGSLTERHNHELRSRTMQRLGTSIAPDEVSKRREEALRRLQSPSWPGMEEDIRNLINGIHARDVM